MGRIGGLGLRGGGSLFAREWLFDLRHSLNVDAFLQRLEPSSDNSGAAKVAAGVCIEFAQWFDATREVT